MAECASLERRGERPGPATALEIGEIVTCHRIYAGLLTRFVTWFEIWFGWAASLLLVAVMSGLAKTDSEKS